MHDNAWLNMLPDFTHTPDWGSHNAYPAGGAIYLDAYVNEAGNDSYNGQLNTPLLNVSANTASASCSSTHVCPRATKS